MPSTKPSRLVTGLGAAFSLSVVLGACTSGASGTTGADASDPEASTGQDASESAAPAAPKVTPFAVAIDAPGGTTQQIAVDSDVRVSASTGTLQRVVVQHGRGANASVVRGTMNAARGEWTLQDTLQPGLTYTVLSTGRDSDGASRTVRSHFSTDNLTLDEQTYPSVAPLQGETVGVGMPVVVTFDVPVKDRAAIERRLSVTSKPQVRGTWHWLSANEVHYRPRSFWPAGADVDVDIDIDSVDAGNGIYGQESRHVSFDVGDRIVSTVNVQTQQMRVSINGSTGRTIAVSGGKPGFETRAGTKVIMEKFESKRMDAATTGISTSDPEYYNIANVEYAMRVTYSGEFLHAAPWSVGSQGNANVSHGCVGMSTADAAWLFGMTNRGDVVRVVGSDRPLEEGNGWTDWDMSWADYRSGSALT
ncbi:MAG: L,D-transpeptidase family protein [Nocardioidaceae bacterium]|nr:L,D-transpeptidase family protein [Nocardioidaceae bacterium]MBA3799490.1 L,D-transpeptidase family protein [Geodermatophilaceae bacterium]